MHHAATCRDAFHHFSDPASAAREMARAVRPGGRLVIADTVSPNDPELADAMQSIEALRDPSHALRVPFPASRRRVGHRAHRRIVCRARLG
ncbi:MAG: methyltransferase domain-containing protein [Actinobacteria bacterium]|nr:methyltransferase domain-containing protein [Actinomycetota bacterium]